MEQKTLLLYTDGDQILFFSPPKNDPAIIRVVLHSMALPTSSFSWIARTPQALGIIHGLFIFRCYHIV